jgi:mannose-6-phosphate isomerase-like protein (cupin superfamily)
MQFKQFSEFEAYAKNLGYDEVLERVWSANQVVAQHTHPFDAHAFVVSGSYRLVHLGVSKELKAGDFFELARNQPHAEHYGPEGCVFWVARKN